MHKALECKAGALGAGLLYCTRSGSMTATTLTFSSMMQHFLPYLSPETLGYDLDLAPSDCETDGARALKIVFEGAGEINFICCEPVTETLNVLADFRGRSVLLETPAEIHEKKGIFRGASSATLHVRHCRHHPDLGAGLRYQGTLRLFVSRPRYPCCGTVNGLEVADPVNFHANLARVFPRELTHQRAMFWRSGWGQGMCGLLLLLSDCCG